MKKQENHLFTGIIIGTLITGGVFYLKDKIKFSLFKEKKEKLKRYNENAVMCKAKQDIKTESFVSEIIEPTPDIPNITEPEITETVIVEKPIAKTRKPKTLKNKKSKVAKVKEKENVIIISEENSEQCVDYSGTDAYVNFANNVWDVYICKQLSKDSKTAIAAILIDNKINYHTEKWMNTVGVAFSTAVDEDLSGLSLKQINTVLSVITTLDDENKALEIAFAYLENVRGHAFRYTLMRKSVNSNMARILRIIFKLTDIDSIEYGAKLIRLISDQETLKYFEKLFNVNNPSFNGLANSIPHSLKFDLSVASLKESSIDIMGYLESLVETK